MTRKKRDTKTDEGQKQREQIELNKERKVGFTKRRKAKKKTKRKERTSRPG
jgi:hypothetical protein